MEATTSDEQEAIKDTLSTLNLAVAYASDKSSHRYIGDIQDFKKKRLSYLVPQEQYVAKSENKLKDSPLMFKFATTYEGDNFDIPVPPFIRINDSFAELTTPRQSAALLCAILTIRHYKSVGKSSEIDLSFGANIDEELIAQITKYVETNSDRATFLAEE